MAGARSVPGPAQPASCATGASDACYFALQLGTAGSVFHYYASHIPGLGAPTPPTQALVVIHGHPRDADKTFNAALQAVTNADSLADTLIVAPVFQVAPAQARRCETAGVPAAAEGDLLWTCGSWLQGSRATNGTQTTSFGALDALLREIAAQWPTVRLITVAGFSAGAQVVQHYIGFAAAQPAGGPVVRYVVADPGTWLYFDPVRPQLMREGAPADWAECASGADPLAHCQLAMGAPAAGCPGTNQWKYGIDALPAALGRSAAEARAVYAAADIHYLEAELDGGAGRGTAYRVLDRSCEAMAQGPFRLQRGLAYAFYDRTVLAPAKQRGVTLVPGCGHDVACVFPAPAARAALLGRAP